MKDIRGKRKSSLKSWAAFVQEFELLVDAVRMSCMFLLAPQSPQHQPLFNILLHHRA